MTTSNRRTITMERTYRASIDDVWELWTTIEGIESWWGPVGFTTEVVQLDLRPGGKLRYAMTATAPDQIAFMNSVGMPLTTNATLTYTEVTATQRLAYVHLADFIPDVTPYDVATLVEFHVEGPMVRMVMTFDAMHDDVWTERSVMGQESQLTKFEKALA
jgi:uncharacterized protein YndB with AHSA1/START domain